MTAKNIAVSPPSTLRVSVELPSGKWREFQFSHSFRIGRSPDCEVQVDADIVSRTHAQVTCESGDWWIRNLDSSNGIYDGEERFERVSVKSSTTVTLGVHGPTVILEVLPTRGKDKPVVATDTILAGYADHYFGKASGEETFGERTLFIRRAFAQVQKKQRAKYLAIMVVLVACITSAAGLIGYFIPVIWYHIVRNPSTHNNGTVPIDVRQGVQIRPDPSDSTITSDDKPVTGGVVAAGATVEVANLGYKTKRVLVQRESDGKIVLEPEPVHLSIQTTAKSGTVKLDGQPIGDLINGSMDEFSLKPDGKGHTLTVIAQGKQLFAVDFQAVPGSRPQVTALDAHDMFVVTSLGNSANVYGGNLLTSVRIGDDTVPVLPSGTDLDLSEQNREIGFGEGDDQGRLVIDINNAPALTVHSITAKGRLMITTSVKEANLTVDGKKVQRQTGGWLITGLVGSHIFAVSANGYQNQRWTMTLLRGQTRAKRIVLVPEVQALALIEITDGTPEADVDVDGERRGQIDANGRLIIRVKPGVYTVAISKHGYEDLVVRNIPVSNHAHILFPNAALRPARP